MPPVSSEGFPVLNLSKKASPFERRSLFAYPKLLICLDLNNAGEDLLSAASKKHPLIGIIYSQLAAQKSHLHVAAFLTQAQLHCCDYRRAGTCAAGQGLPATSFPDTHAQIVPVNKAHKLRIHPLGKQW